MAKPDGTVVYSIRFEEQLAVVPAGVTHIVGKTSADELRKRKLVTLQRWS